MEKLREILDEYGLQLGFINEEDPIVMLDDIVHIEAARKKRKENAFEGLLYILEDMVLKVIDYRKIQKKMNLPAQYNDISFLIEQDTCLEIRKNFDETVCAEFRLINNENYGYGNLERRIKRNLEKFGLSEEEIKLKEMFGEKDIVSQKALSIYTLLEELTKDKTIEKALRSFIQNIKNELESQENNPEWYLEYGKRNKVFKELLRGIEEEGDDEF